MVGLLREKLFLWLPLGVKVPLTLITRVAEPDILVGSGISWYLKSGKKNVTTVCPGSSDPFYIVSYYIKWVITSWT